MTLATRTALEQEIIESLRRLPRDAQERVLDFTRELGDSQLVGTPGSDLLRFVAAIDAADLEKMKEAIERDCERIDADGW